MAEGITRITVKGFKSLAEECSIEICPLTILAGANSSGKSSIMQPLLLMKQTLEATYDPGPLLLDGPNVRFTSADQFLSRSDGKKESTFSAGLELGSVKFSNGIEMKNFISFYATFIKTLIGMDTAEISYRIYDETTILKPEMTQEEMMIAAKTRLKKYPNTDLNNLNISFEIERNRFFLDLIISNREETFFIRTGERENFINAILGLIHLPALRGNPERNYKKTSVGPRFPGTFEIYAASIIHHWQATQDQRLHSLGAALELLGLTWKVGARKVDDVSVEVMVGRLIHEENDDSDDLVSIADVGFGISQTLPVIVALLAAEPGQLVYIEQPEIHLHPKAQMAMAQILADAANRGVRVVAETHSALLLLGIQSLVAEGKLSADKVKLHWFKRRPEDGVTEVSSADLDKAGAFGDWPEDFSSAEMDADTRYIHAAEAKLESN
jgi:AAA15 family ATPase/GTPase